MTAPKDLDFSRVGKLEISEQWAGQRIDNFLHGLLKGVPRSRVYRIIRKGEVRVNKGRVDPHYKLKLHDQLRLPPIRVDARPSPVAVGEGLRRMLAERVLYEDDAMLVLDKPEGLAVHGGSGLQLGLIEALREVRANTELELVHRLDRDTSGCLMISKRRPALRALHQALREGRVAKHYTAVASGKWPAHCTDVRAPLLKNVLSSGERMVVVDRQGKASHTRFSVLQRCGVATLVEAEPVTGRTHQIRVHARFVGCPLVGDDKYGSDEDRLLFRPLGVRRLYLHAARLRFELPGSGEPISVTAPLPAAFDQLLTRLRG